MGHEAIKLELIEWLAKLNDQETLDYLKIVKDSCTENRDWWSDITEQQRHRIKKGLSDVDEGRVVSHNEIKTKYDL